MYNKKENPHLSVILADATILMTSNDMSTKGTPPSNSSLALLTNNLHRRLIGLIRVVPVVINIEDGNCALITHTLLGNSQQPPSVGRKLNTLDGGGQLPLLDLLAGLDVPQTHSVVGRAGGDEDGVGGDVDSPDGTEMALVSA